MSGDPGPSTKAISSLAKKQTDVTRQGAQKLKFVPTLPGARRKKDEVKAEADAEHKPAPTPSRTQPQRGKGRGRGSAQQLRGAAPTLTASGPFAMGPAMATGNLSRKSIPRSKFGPSLTGIPGAPTPGSSLSGTSTPTIKLEDSHIKLDDEAYSDPEDGVDIIDLSDVKSLDWMAPDALKKESVKQKRVKTEESDGVDTANALDLSESEEEEEMESIQESFLPEYGGDATAVQDRLYFFQFPSPFPEFVSDNDNEIERQEKRVSFAPDTKAEQGTTKAPEVDGVIGQLEIYRSGVVKIRLENGILLDVTSATQPSFLQYAVHVDTQARQMSILGEVNKKFVVSPDIDGLLEALDQAEMRNEEDSDIYMDTS